MKNEDLEMVKREEIKMLVGEEQMVPLAEEVLPLELDLERWIPRQ